MEQTWKLCLSAATIPSAPVRKPGRSADSISLAWIGLARVEEWRVGVVVLGEDSNLCWKFQTGREFGKLQRGTDVNLWDLHR